MLNISIEGFEWLVNHGYNPEEAYQDDEGWWIDYGSFWEFLDEKGLEFDEDTYCVYWANMRPSQEPIFIGAN